MSSLINSAMSGLSAAQSALNTVSNNISAITWQVTPARRLVLGASNSTLTAVAGVGKRARCLRCQREYDAFITNQLRAARNAEKWPDDALSADVKN